MEHETLDYELHREQELYREVVAILMGSRFYFELTLEERYRLVRHILESSSLSNPERWDDRRPPCELTH